MRFHDIFEAPISHYEVHGMDQPGSFSDVDRRNLPSPQHIEKVKKHFADTEHNFSLYFANMAGKSYVQTVGGKTDFTSEWQNIGRDHAGLSSPEAIFALTGVRIVPDADAINVVFMSNANAERSITMTPWIMAHRIGHALTDREESLPADVRAGLNKIPSASTTVATYVPPGKPSKKVNVQTQDVLTMRSARTGNLNPGEEREELFAQFLMRGSITFRLQPELAANDPAALTSLNAQLVQKARSIESALYSLLDGCVGHVFLAI